MHTSDLVLDLASAVLSAVLAILPESFFAGSLALYFLPAMAVSFPAAHLIAGWCVDRLDGDSETHPWDRD